MKMIDVTAKFRAGNKCLDYLEQLRWPAARCLCALRVLNVSKITREKAGKKQTRSHPPVPRERVRKQFSATSGTIFDNLHLPITAKGSES